MKEMNGQLVQALLQVLIYVTHGKSNSFKELSNVRKNLGYMFTKRIYWIQVGSI